MKHVDAILLTHSHADHILGLDEVRRFNVITGNPIPCYASPETWETVWRTFHYIFDGVQRKGGGVPKIDAHEIRRPLTIGGARRPRARLARRHAGARVPSATSPISPTAIG